MPLEQLPIRLEVSTVSNPPVEPVDINTGATPCAWRSAGIEVDIGVFDGSLNSVDLSNLAQLQVALYKSDDAVVPLETVVVLAANIVPTIARGSWLDGSAQNARAIFTAAQMDQGLQAQTSRTFWVVVQGITDANQIIVYGAGNFTIFNAGGNVPTGTGGYVSFNTQTNTAGNAQINPASQLHLEEITVGGSARTSQLVVSLVGLVAGAMPKIRLQLPATAAIVLNVRNGTASGAIVATLTTNGSARAVLFELDFNGTALELLRTTDPLI